MRRLAQSTRMLCLFAAICGFTGIGAPAALAQGRFCGDHEAITQLLERRFDERAKAFGVTASGQLLEIFASPNGTWTIIVTTPDGRSCLMSNGEGWRSVAPENDDPVA